MRWRTHYGIYAALLTMTLLVLGTGTALAAEHKDGEAAIGKAVAVLHPTEGNTASGTVTFTREKNGVRVVAAIKGLSPGPHGFHIHEYGDCSAPDATSAGEHFNPQGTPHAAPTAEARHVGDLGNIVADNSGVAKLNWVDPLLAFEGPNSMMGRSVVVHAKPDDFTTQPTGGAGPRLACGVVGIAKK